MDTKQADEAATGGQKIIRINVVICRSLSQSFSHTHVMKSNDSVDE